MNDKFEKAFETYLESSECEKSLDFMQESIRYAFECGYKMGLSERMENEKNNNIDNARIKYLGKAK